MQLPKSWTILTPTGPHAALFKWSAMLVGILWVLIYRLSEEAARVPEFVYVNF